MYRGADPVFQKCLKIYKTTTTVIFGCKNHQELYNFVDPFIRDLIHNLRLHGFHSYSNRFYNYLFPQLKQYTEQFIHEFHGFASSKYNTIDHYDSHAKYNRRNRRTNSETPFLGAPGRTRDTPIAPRRPPDSTPTPRRFQDESSDEEINRQRPTSLNRLVDRPITILSQGFKNGNFGDYSKNISKS